MATAKKETPIEVLAAQFFSDHRDHFINFTIMQGVSGLLISWKDVNGKNGNIIEMEENKDHYTALCKDNATRNLIRQIGIPPNRMVFASNMTLTETPPPGRSS